MAAQHKGASHDLPSLNGVSVAEHVDMENTRELSLMRAFAQRRRPESTRPVALGNGTSANGPAAVPPSSVEEEEPKKKKKKKNFLKRLLESISCVPRGAEADDGGPAGSGCSRAGVSPACADEGETQQSKSVDVLTTKLIEIANSSFIPPEIESDAEEGEIEKLAGLLLRHCGDTVEQDYDCAKMFTEMLSSYSMFGNLMSTIFLKIGLTNDPGDRGPKGSDKIQTNIAVTCEVATRLSAMDTHPMNRALGFGARYLKEHYPLEEALNADKDQDIDTDVE
ncbi:apoptosis facilitator Bcl-2-like protein 14 [Gadus chalcogrammus]|uniref:apoptosis facilitator Bcl-2-like protein 14 n=1 Tax=Gadus chalcogrammus TaxID=1042646 RepID=UPI0024C4A4F2|nr:apoptosis facilitator Bcl-2-like protein 14 [Gadus chalcogrammus]XP_056434013.1 apoptosis facilitator Bcl-2-like protein 14 [Gadus chalcogrammus]